MTNSDSSSSSLSEENNTIDTLPFNDVSIDIENPSNTENIH